ncbi:KRAB-A domain-containing protein 2-like [Mytilus galloprovincialis]|uniref:KRAB-A domain-containing protein 2-like n=1 Tax=Mytilus galloprovincialis TaxID=29158 RepID=UPI003F7C76AD
MPCYKGFNYVCNILDYYSRFAFGCATKTKTAKEIADVVLKYIYLYGAPRILQSDNGKEFTNKDLEGVVEEFKSKQIHGRPYHPQSQGRVERFNRTMTTFFRVKMSTLKDWVEELPHFYYTYNNRVNSVTKPLTPYQMYFKRPNFATPVEEQEINLTSENVQSCQVLLIEEKENEVVQNNTASPYYSEMYRTRFGRPPSLISSESPSKRIHLQEINGNQSTFINAGITQYFDSEQMYPVELFSKNSLDDITSYIYYNEGDIVDYRTSPAMNKGTAVFISGFWRRGLVIKIDKCPRRGTLYTVKDDIKDFCFQINRHQIRIAQ